MLPGAVPVCTCALALWALAALGRSYNRTEECETSHEGDGTSKRNTALQPGNRPFQPVGPFPFMKLPAEIRNMVYRLILVDVDLDLHEEPYRPRLSVLRQPALTRVSRQIREDTLGMFLAHNFFVLEVPMPESDYDIDFNHARQEQRWRWFLRSVKLLAASDRLARTKHLTISYGAKRWPTFMGIDPQPGLTIEVFNYDPRTLEFGERVRSAEIRRDEIDLHTKAKLVLRNRIGHDDTNWGDVDAVEEALDHSIEYLTRFLRAVVGASEANHVQSLPVGCLVQALHALCGAPGSQPIYLFLSMIPHVL